MDNYFTSFCLLNHLRVNEIRAKGVLNKNSLCKCTIIGDKQLKKWNVVTLNRKQKISVTFIRATSGWLHSFF